MKNNIPQNKSSAVMAGYSGPLPVAQQFQQYEQILPGAAERILKQAEREQENRFLNDTRTHEANDAIIKTTHIEKMSGIIIGGIICIGIVVTGAGLVFSGHDWAGASIVGATVVGVATAFVTGRKYSSQFEEK